MSIGADVRSISVLREWLAALAVYQDEAGAALASMNMELRRGLDWVEQQLHQWQQAVRQAEEAVTQAKAELVARQFPGWDGREPDTTLQERNLRRAEAWHEHCEDQVRRCRGWLARLPKIIEETYTGHGHRLQIFLEGDMARGLATLNQRLEALERYTGDRTDYRSTPSAIPGPSGGSS
jgi:hypothetical protein